MPNYINESYNNNEISCEKTLQRTASKTVRKFTSHFGCDSLPQSVSVSCDWLSMMCLCLLPEPEKDQGPIFLTDNVVLEYQMKGTPIFNYSYIVYLEGEPVAKVHTHGKNPKIMKEGIAKLEIENHVFYSNTMLEVKDKVMLACKMSAVKNYSGLHIAIDGVEHIHKFLNAYIRQDNNRVKPELRSLGRWDKMNRVRLKGKANVDAKRFNKTNGLFDNFKVGSSRKYLTLYNKTSELERSHKQYIRDAWDRAGIDTKGTVWRCELRLTSQSIKEIKDFDINKITDPNYLLQIFKTQCKNFFEFILMEGDGNVSRARIIDLFQFEKLRVPLLGKIPRAIVRGAYKAQMAIHNAYANVRLRYLKTEGQIFAALQHITDNVQLYNLDRWFERKKPQWDLLYLGSRSYEPGDYREQLK